MPAISALSATHPAAGPADGRTGHHAGTAAGLCPAPGCLIAHAAVRLATLGYAVPGTVLAVGVFVPVAWLDNQFAQPPALARRADGHFKGTAAVMLLALAAPLCCRGLFSGRQYCWHASPKAKKNRPRLLGMRGLPLLRRVYLPQLRGGLPDAALLMVLVDTMKEMPITLMTRPFGWDTLAVRVFEMTSEGQWDRAALPSVAIVLTGLIPVLLLARETRS